MNTRTTKVLVSKERSPYLSFLGLLALGVVFVALVVPASVHARPEIGIMPVHVIYPASENQWVGVFIQEELTRQFTMSQQFSILPAEVMRYWYKKLKVSFDEKYQREHFHQMRLKILVVAGLQKVLKRTSLQIQVHTLHNNQVLQSSSQATHPWNPPDQFFTSLFAQLAKEHPALEKLQYHPQNFTWEGLKAFYNWKALLTQNTKPLDWSYQKQQLELLEFNDPSLKPLTQSTLAKLLISESTASQPLKVALLEQAEDALKNVLSLNTDDDEAHTLSALILYLKNEKNLAKAEVVVANAQNPYNGLAWVMYGITIGKRYEDGERFIQTGLKLYPFHLLVKSNIHPFYNLIPKLQSWISVEESAESQEYQQWIKEGQALFSQHQWKLAEDQFQKAHQAFPLQLEPQILTVRTFIQQNRYADALKLLNQLQEKYPENDQIVYYQGVIQEQLQYYTEAESYYRKALHLKAENPKTLLRLAAILVKTKRYEEAQSFLESLTRKYPTYVAGWGALGQLYKKLEMLDKAQAAFEEALRLDPENSKIQKNLEVIETQTD
ncbi:tetratricopeptide repeat protein [Deltaproteobacteria bacterium TL4]